MTGQVLSNSNVTDAFVISNGVKLGCVLAPVFFNVFFTCMLSHAVHDLENGVYIRCCLDGSLFELRRLTAKTKSLQTLLQEVLFANDCALVALAEQDLKRMLDRFSEASKQSSAQRTQHPPINETEGLQYRGSSLPPSSMFVRHGHCIAGISRNWSSSTCELFAPSWESSGRTTSPILEVLDQTKSTSIEATIIKAQLRRVGQVI